MVTVEAKEVDRDGRTIADVFLADGTNLNRELVKEGLVWWFSMKRTSLHLDDRDLKALERLSRGGDSADR